MLKWVLGNAQSGEFPGQPVRIVGAATKTVLGLVPRGNAGGVNVSRFKVMPFSPEYQDVINHAKFRALIAPAVLLKLNLT